MPKKGKKGAPPPTQEELDVEKYRLTAELAVADAEDLRRLAGIGDRQNQVSGGNHAEIPMTGFTGVYKKGRRAGAGQGRCDLAANVSGFPHSSDDHAPGARQQGLAGVHKPLVKA